MKDEIQDAIKSLSHGLTKFPIERFAYVIGRYIPELSD